MPKEKKYDVCIIGSGAGAGPVAYELALAGHQVLILEKGPWIKTKDFSKDEIVSSRRSVYTPKLKDEPQVIEKQNSDGEWIARSNYETGQDMWNGNCVGGSSNFMSGYFNRLKPNDFQLLSKYGEIEGANIVDWPLKYEDLEAYYAKVEQIIGISGKVIPHPMAEPRSTTDFPYPPLAENVAAKWVDQAALKLDYKSLVLPRAILSRPQSDRNPCYYSGYCGSYGCSSDAKGSSRAALLNKALKSGNLDVIPNAKVFNLEEEHQKVVVAHYYDIAGQAKKATAKIFVVAAQAIETSRLLLMSKSPNFPNGLANNSGQVGRNLIFSGGGSGSGEFYREDLDEASWNQLKAFGVFVNRTIHQWYEIEEEPFAKPVKGGSIDFLMEHNNGITRAIHQKWDNEGNLVYGSKLKEKLKHYFTELRSLNFEVFVDWLPTDDCYVKLSEEVTDKWGDPVAHIRIYSHERDVKVGQVLAKKAEHLLAEMGARNISSNISGAPPPNLVAGGCRFGEDPKESVLNPHCQAHDVSNLFVTDGSWMPTGGSVTHTWTIYANSFRVADIIRGKLGE
ncbi:GMC family oxidoreductase [Lentimicrobium sp. L6]|uniref:GMC family oxidoreductase n=1 Tax=Lentimicrobium sp. L6 TaxID=2735916 RepID=UPI001554241B|nr:GMC family oxidoreductase [Lentimicrobium sp. L6]NPD85361.1 GMC family oxidoreductase [Lentimicrobium sp. L6]